MTWKKFDVQTDDKIIQLTQDLAMFTKKEKEIIEVKHKRNVSFMEARKIVGSYIGENSYASVAWSGDRTNEDNKYRTLVEKLVRSEWLAKVSGTPEKTTLGRILLSSSWETSWEWGEIQYCGPNKNTRRIYHSNTNYS